MELRAPRVRGTCEPFSSQILPRYQRASDAIRALLPELYLQGLAAGALGFLDGGAKQAVLNGKDVSVAITQLLQEARGALDVGEGKVTVPVGRAAMRGLQGARISR